MVCISVIVPTIRDSSLNEKCLAQQTFTDFEVIIQRPTRVKPKENFYDLNYDYNLAFGKAKGDLIISYQDGIQIQPDCLERFWYWHGYHKGKACIGAVGDQFSSLNPPIKVWTDPRRNDKYGTHYEIIPLDLEFTLAALPRQAILDVSGLKLNWDKFAALSEKEMCARIDMLGYKFYISQDIEYRALKHERLKGDKKWNEAYKAGCKYYEECMKDIQKGINLKGDL